MARYENLYPAVHQALDLQEALAVLLYGFRPRVTSTYRTFQTQARLFNDPGFQALPPGQSQHEYGFSYDIAPQVSPGNFLYEVQQTLLVHLGAAIGMRWGGSSEPWHFQLFSRQEWQEFLGISSLRPPEREPHRFPQAFGPGFTFGDPLSGLGGGGKGEIPGPFGPGAFDSPIIHSDPLAGTVFQLTGFGKSGGESPDSDRTSEALSLEN